MSVNGAYTSEEVVKAYDHRRFGGSGGRYVFQKDCKTLESLLGSSQVTLLDIPCGTGVYAERFGQVGYRLVAADASLPMLQKTAQRTKSAPRVLCDICHLPFRDDAFDATTTIRLFQHYPKDDIAQMLRELKRVIRSEGKVIFDTFRWTPRRMPFLRYFFKGEMFVFSHQQIEEIIMAVGLRQVREISLYLFSPIWQRKLPAWILWGLNVLENVLPQRWLLRTFWACTKD